MLCVTYVFSCILWIVPRHFTQESLFQMGFYCAQIVSIGITNTPISHRCCLSTKVNAFATYEFIGNIISIW